MRAFRAASRRLSTAPQLQPLQLCTRPLIQPHDQRPAGTIDQLTGREVKATSAHLGVEVTNIDLTQQLTMEECEVIKQASDDAGGTAAMLTVWDVNEFVGSSASRRQPKVPRESHASFPPQVSWSSLTKSPR